MSVSKRKLFLSIGFLIGFILTGLPKADSSSASYSHGSDVEGALVSN